MLSLLMMEALVSKKLLSMRSLLMMAAMRVVKPRLRSLKSVLSPLPKTTDFFFGTD